MCPLLLQLPRVLVAVFAASSWVAQAQDFERAPSTWQEHLDLQTSAAASSTVMHFRCVDAAAQNAALERTGVRLGEVLQAVVPLGATYQEAHDYASDAYRRKISALWQSSSQTPCAGLTRLRDIASYAGYPVPLQLRR